MRLFIDHTTRYVYETPVTRTVQQIRFTPPTDPGQSVVEWRLEGPAVARACSYDDAFGNRVHLVVNDQPHTKAIVRAYGVVETVDRAGVLGPMRGALPDAVYTRFTELTQPVATLRRWAQAIDPVDLVASLHELMRHIHKKIVYRIGITEAHTPVTEVLATGEGVCQDHAHVFIACARIAGLPARYVSGYLLLEADQSSEAHHAWAEVLIEGLGWVGFDVSNVVCATDHHVRLAVGLDSRYAAPIRGIRVGGAAETLTVEVSVTSQNF